METQTETAAPAKEPSKSIIPEKYRVRKDPDWLAGFIDDQVRMPIMKTVAVKDEQGNDAGTEEKDTGKTAVDLDALFKLCELNHVKTDKMRAQTDRPNAPGRIRMTLGNSLRAAAKRRHGLFALDGEWTAVPEGFVEAGTVPTEMPDGTRFAVAKPAADAPSTEDAPAD